MGNRIAPAGGIRISFALLAFALVASLVQVVSIAPAQAVAGDTGPAPIPGAVTTSLSDGQWETKNQHRIWWNSTDSRWDAILPATAGWRIARGAIPTTPGASPLYGPTVATAGSDRPDIYWDDANNRLYVLMSGGSTTLHTFNYVGGAYVLDFSSSLPSMEPDEGRVAIYKVPGGNLWASMSHGTGLFVARSIDDGATWQGPVKLHNVVAEGQSQLAHFDSGGTTQIGVAAAEDGDDTVVSQYLFYRIDDSDGTWDAVVHATGTLNLVVQPTDGQYVIIGNKTYTFRNAVGMPDVDGNVAIGATLAATRTNLVGAVNLIGGTYAPSTTGNPLASMSNFNAGGMGTITARESGLGGNAVPLASSSSGNPVSGPTLTGGSSPWTRELLPLSSPSGLTHADDELSLVRNTNGDLYVATETQRPTEGTSTEKRADPQVIVFRRVAATNTWTQHVVKRDDATATTDRKRPVVAILDGIIYVIAISQPQTSSGYRTAQLATMNFGVTDYNVVWNPLFNTQFEEYRNNIVPREPTTAATKLPVLIDWAWDEPSDEVPPNTQDSTIWQTSLPNSGNQAPGVNAGLDKTVAIGSPTNLGGLFNDSDPVSADNPIGRLWTKISGPGTVTFSNPASDVSTATFSAQGVYVLRLTATESGPNPLSNFDDVRITVTPGNNAPTISVSEPDNGDTAAAGALITFSATATDPETGNIAPAIKWTSSRDGAIGTGAFFQRTLSNGVHTIKATVSDGQNTVSSPNITLTVGSGGGGGGGGSNNFIDDNGHIFENAITWLAGKGITQGCNPPTNNRFCPDDAVTRGEMAVFLVRAFKYQDNGGGNLFVDDNGTFYENSADRLFTAGVTQGCNPPTNNRFCGENNVTRGQMAAFLVRAFNLPAYNGPDRFVDDNGHLFEGAIERLAQAGITLGCNPPTNNRFCPNQPVTRGQMAAFLKRAFGE